MNLFDDEREIVCVWDDHFHFAVGRSFNLGGEKVQRITISKENGQMAHVPWIEIWCNGEVRLKMDAVGKTIEYKRHEA